jgi:hypothetical protein
VRRQIEVDLDELGRAIHAVKHGRRDAAVSLIEQTMDRLQILKRTAWEDERCEHPNLFAKGEDAYAGQTDPTEHCNVCNKDIPITEL